MAYPYFLFSDVAVLQDHIVSKTIMQDSCIIDAYKLFNTTWNPTCQVAWQQLYSATSRYAPGRYTVTVNSAEIIK